MYQGNFTEADRVIVETIFDKTKQEEKKLKTNLSMKKWLKKWEEQCTTV